LEEAKFLNGLPPPLDIVGKKENSGDISNN
jgi:hypothetical protein